MLRRAFRRPALPTVLGLVCLLLVAPGCRKATPPVPGGPQGQPEPDANALLDDYAKELRDRSPTKRQEAIKALLQIDAAGTDVVPALLEALKDNNSAPLGEHYPRQPFSTREAAVLALLKLGPRGEQALTDSGLHSLTEGLKDPSPAVREHTAYALELIGPKAKPAAGALAALCADKQKEVRRAAYRALEAIGSAPVMPIVKLLNDKDPEVCSDAAEALTWLRPLPQEAVPQLAAALQNDKLTEENPDVAFFVRNAAAEALASLGSQAKEAVPALIGVVKTTGEQDLLRLRHPEEAGHLRALRRIGEPAVAPLTKLLKDNNWVVRWQAALTLGAIGRPAKEALPALQAVLENEEKQPEASLEVVAAAALAQVRIGGDPKQPVAAITKLLGHMFPRVRYYAAQVLWQLGPKAADAVPALIRLLDDEEEAVRGMAVEALRAIGPAAKAAVPALVKKLSDEEAEVRLAAANALKGLGPVAAEATPELAKALSGEDEDLRKAALEALAAIGPAAKPAAPELAKLLANKAVKPNVRANAAEVLGVIGAQAREASGALLDFLAEVRKPPLSEQTGLRLAAVRALGRVGGGEAVVTKLVEEAQKDPSGQVREEAIRALGHMGPAAKAAVPALKAIADVPGDRRVLAAAALVPITGESKPYADVVLQALRDASPANRLNRAAAMDSLELLGPAAKEAVPDLTDALRDKNLLSRSDGTTVRQKAARALGALGPAAKPAVPKLADLLKEKDENLKRTVIEALARIGPAAEFAAPRLREVARNDETLRDDAERALEKIEGAKR